MFSEITFSDYWTEEEVEYLKTRLDSLVGKTSFSERGCLVHRTSTEEKISPTIGMKPLRLFPGRKRVSLSIYRFIALVIYGPVTLSSVVRHVAHTECGTKFCYYWKHFVLGTIQENIHDKFRDGTANTTLSDEDVLTIFENEEGLNYEELADQYDVAEDVIRKIFTGESWSRVTELDKPVIIRSKEEVHRYILDNTDFYLDKIKNTVKIKEETGCWIWQNHLAGGYGAISVLGFGFGAHRFNWSLVNGRFPKKDEVIRHRCGFDCYGNPLDERSCVNPDHLLIGSYSDNQKDKCLFGEDTTNAKLHNEEVLVIKTLLEEGKRTIISIARQYGVVHSTIRNIRDGRTWSFLTGILLDNTWKLKNLEDKTVADIRFILSLAKFSQIEIALKYSISPQVISCIYLKTTYEHVETAAQLSEESEFILSQLEAEQKERDEKDWSLEEYIPKAARLPDEKVSDITILLGMGKFFHKEIAFYFKTSESVISGINTHRCYKGTKIQNTLSERGKNILVKLESKEEIIYPKVTIKRVRTKLTPLNVADIRFILHLGKFDEGMIASHYGVETQTITNIEYRNSHKDIERAVNLSPRGEDILKKLEIESEEKNRALKQEVGDIKYILNLNKFSQENIGLQFQRTRRKIGEIKRKEDHRNIPASAELSPRGKIILQNLEDELSKNPKRGKAGSKVELTSSQVGDIKFLLKTGRFTQEDIAPQYSVLTSLICSINIKRTRKDIETPSELSEEGEIILEKLEALLLERYSS